MELVYFADKHFEKVNISEVFSCPAEYEQCTYAHCILADANLAGSRFVQCAFADCDLSLAMLTKTSFQQTTFTGCKMLGLQFDQCETFNLSFSCTGCNLGNCVFYKLNLKGASFTECNFQEADFTDADLSGAIFHNCNLSGAQFYNTNLEKADLRTAFNFSIDPARNRLKKARFSLSGLPGLLEQWQIIVDNY